MMEQRQKVKQVTRRASTPDEVKQQLDQGRKLVFVDKDMDVPDNYVLLTVNFRGQKVRAVIPAQTVYFMAHPGEGGVGNALDDIADFYGEAEEYEDQDLGRGEPSVQKTDITTAARTAYEVYLINKLTQDGKNFDSSEVARLGLETPYINERVRGIAAICLGKSVSELQRSKLETILTHKTLSYAQDGFADHSETESYQVKCDCGSHYELRTKYRTVTRRKRELQTKTVDVDSIEQKVEGLEQEIEQYRITHGQVIGRHDKNLIRAYTNLAYIAQENPSAQLDINPLGGKKKENATESRI